MKPRNAEGHRLEADYLARLRAALAGRDPSETSEIVESVRDHIEEALAETAGDEVTLVQMAAVLERLGPPESFADEESSAVPQREAAGAVPESPQPQATLAPPPSSEELSAAADLLDKAWIGYLFIVLGLFIPFAEFNFCSLIGHVILAAVLLKYHGLQAQRFNSAGKLAVAAAIMVVLVVPFNLLRVAEPAFGLLAFPVTVAMVVCFVLVYWKVLGGAASVLQTADQARLADHVRGIRIYYIVYLVFMIVLGLIIGVILVAVGVRNLAEVWWLGYALLPLGWVAGYLLELRPLSQSRRALRAAAGEGNAPWRHDGTATDAGPGGGQGAGGRRGGLPAWVFVAVAMALVVCVAWPVLAVVWFVSPDRPSPAEAEIGRVQEALRNGDTTALGIFLHLGGDPNIPDDGGDTLLHSVALAGNLEMVRLLVENGANQNAVNHERRTPLNYAVRGHRVRRTRLDGLPLDYNPDHLAVLRFLLEHWADPSIADDSGKTPLDWAKVLHDDELAAEIERHLEAAPAPAEPAP